VIQPTKLFEIFSHNLTFLSYVRKDQIEILSKWNFKSDQVYNFDLQISEVKSQDSIVDIATGYGLDDWGVEVRVPMEVRIFFSSSRPDWL
jgi:hypothetical protein